MRDRSSGNSWRGWDSEVEGQQITNYSGLFVSLLLRYPELGSVKYSPNTGCLVMGFMLNATMSPHEFNQLRDFINQSLRVFTELSGNAVHVLNIQHIEYEPYSTIEITRDVATLTPGELSLIVGILRHRYADRLIYDALDQLAADSLNIQDDIIEHMLDDVRQIPPHRDLIGFREGGRVVLFGGNDHNP